MRKGGDKPLLVVIPGGMRPAVMPEASTITLSQGTTCWVPRRSAAGTPCPAAEALQEHRRVLPARVPLHLQPLGASVSPLVLGLGAHSSQGSGAAGTTEAGHGRGSPQGGHAPAHTGLQAPQPLSGSPPWPQPAPRSPPSQRRPQARTPRADTVVSGECPPQRRPFSRLPGAGLREGGVTSAESAVKARPEHHTSLNGNVCSLNDTEIPLMER